MADEHLNLLLVEDEAIDAVAEQQILQRNGYEVQVVHSGGAAIAVLDDQLRFMYVSNRWLRDYQCPDSDIAGRHHSQPQRVAPPQAAERGYRAAHLQHG